MKKNHPTFQIWTWPATALALLAMAGPSAAKPAGTRVNVQVPVANFYTQPSRLAPILDVLTRGDDVTLIQREGAWYAARLPDDRLGWVRQDIFRETEIPASAADPETPATEAEAADPLEPPPFPERVRVASRSAQVRKRPSDRADIAFSLRREQIVNVEDREGEWYRISDEDGRRGWAFVPLFAAAPGGQPPAEAPAESAAETAEAALPAEAAAPDPVAGLKRALVEVRSGRVRQSPSLDAPVETGISRGEVVTVTDENEEWYAIQTNEGKIGWAHRNLFGPITGGMLTKIRTEPGDPDSEAETVVFELNGFHPPDTFALEEDNLLKIVCDFKGVLPSETLDRVVPLEGKYLKRVRIGVHKTPELKVRAVVDLSPDRQYGVEQVFFRESNRYVLKIRPAAPEGAATAKTGTTG
jgi:uncharacterized protein YgiM (DUF1202 family)